MGSVAVPPSWVIDDEPTCLIGKSEYPQRGTAPFPTKAEEIQAVFSTFLSDFNDIFASRDYVRLSSVFNTESSFWRDHIGLTDSKFTTLSSFEIVPFIKYHGCQIRSFSGDREPAVKSLDLAGTIKTIQSFITFESTVGTGRGVIRLIQDVHDSNQWKIYTIYTALWDLHGFHENASTGANRPMHGKPASIPKSMNWKDYVEEKQQFKDEEPAVLVVGAGHCGLMTAARLGMLGVKTLVIDKQSRVGDSWRKRYHHLTLHDPCWMNAMPYLAYPTNWPMYASKDKLADFMEYYASALELNVWNQTQIIKATWSDEKKRWTVVLESNRMSTPIRSIHYPRHIVQATGLNGLPKMPDVPQILPFGGKIYHSSEFIGAGKDYAGKKIAVVGTGNSGHDIAYDAYLHGANVTMVQRSSTYVISMKSTTQILTAKYNESIPTTDTDIMNCASPVSLLQRMSSEIGEVMYNQDLPLLHSLQAVGFSTVTPPNLPSILTLAQTRASGFHIDIGCSSVIASGGIKVHQGRNISHLTQDSMVFDDGSSLEADEIIYATGYVSGKTWTRQIFGDSVADRIETIWGMDPQGEQRGVFKRSGHPGFWVAAGSFWFARHYSRFLALQIKGIEEGVSEF
ncbi:flavin-binding monooxygenase-like protein [Phlyctema vagabunda]|uniref:Flavin-binding monooxygenase-like protein n=1 Tax=Phlyctema vagabunda TaxID=108571 RepID=A0ABR4PXZ7_9HELO